MNIITVDDLFGLFIIGVKDNRKFVSYYDALFEIMPLLRNKEFLHLHTGSYINASNFKDVRLSYFVMDSLKDDFILFVEDAVKNSEILVIKDEIIPYKERVSINYGGLQYEKRFRNYLPLISRIGLDMMEVSPNIAKTLVLTYRWRTFPLNGDVESHFRTSFEENSETYNSLSKSEREQLWEDLGFWPNPPQVDWAHFLINLVLSYDWNDRLMDIRHGGALTIEQINQAIPKDYGFTIDIDENRSK